MTYKRAPGTQICDFCGKEEVETIKADGAAKVYGWGTVEWRVDGPGDDYDYKSKDLCPECLEKIQLISQHLAMHIIDSAKVEAG